VAPISIRPWSGLIDFERFTIFHTSTSVEGHDSAFGIPHSELDWEEDEIDFKNSFCYPLPCIISKHQRTE